MYRTRKNVRLSNETAEILQYSQSFGTLSNYRNRKIRVIVIQHKFVALIGSTSQNWISFVYSYFGKITIYRRTVGNSMLRMLYMWVNNI